MKVALITGGTRGIGRAIVEEFARAGYAVAFTFHANHEAAENLVECLRSQGTDACAFQGDVRDFGRAREIAGQVKHQLGPVSALVNNAGIKRDRAFTLLDPTAWHDVIDTNLNGTFNYCRALMKDLMLQGGSILNVTSVSGITGIAGQASYSASKAGIIGLTKALAKEVARFHVRVNAIAPGFIDTDMTAAMDENARAKQFASIPMGRPGSVCDVARVALFLATEGAAYVTGQVWTMDGGLS
jgi:3-oxoacyl-[acyl-carrier protein] reductase